MIEVDDEPVLLLYLKLLLAEGVGAYPLTTSTMSREMCERLTVGRHTPERCLEAAFRFLLDREPKGVHSPDAST